MQLRSVLHHGRDAESRPATSRSAWAITILKRLRVLPAVLGAAAALAAIGTTLFGDFRPGANPPKNRDDGPRTDGARLVEELAVTKFSKLPTLTYQPRDGDMLFAWQIRPTVCLLYTSPSPRDQRGSRMPSSA